MQGMFSRTLFVTLADGSEVVVQFRTELLDLDAFKGRWARLSPMPEFLRMKDWRTMVHWAYSFTRMRGKMWHHGIVGKGAEGRIAVTGNKSLGRVFSKGCLADNSEAVVGKIWMLSWHPHWRRPSPTRTPLKAFLTALKSWSNSRCRLLITTSTT